MDKLLSVIIPTFNRQRLTDRAVESAVTNNYGNVEIIVVDDCGPDPYRYSKPKNSSGVPVRVIRNEVNAGPGGARKRGVDESSGKLVVFMDSDDEFGPKWLDTIITEYQNNENVVRRGLIIIGSIKGGKRAQQIVWSLLRKVPHPVKLHVARVITVMFNPFYTPSLAMSKELCFFKEGLRYCEDYYTASIAVFKAQRLIASSAVGCVLGRHPSELGGISDARRKMFVGEFVTRIEILRSDAVNVLYKSLIPIGMLFQLLRSALKLRTYL